MFSVKSVSRRAVGRAAILAAGLLLAACQPITLGGAGGAAGPKVDPNAPVQVALLVPGGSSNSNDSLLAKNLENAARLAVSDLQGVQVELKVYNTAGNAGTAAEMATKAVAEGAKIIVGPLYAEAANAAGVAASAAGVNVMAFSNNTAIAGGNVFVLGNTFQNTARRMLGFAKKKGKSSVMLVHATNTAGLAGRDAVTAAAAAKGMSIAGVGSYEFSQTGVVQAAPAIVRKTKESKADAIFLTSNSAGALPLLAELLPDNGLKPGTVQFLGLTRWDIPAQTLGLPGVQGAWFALPDPSFGNAFKGRYNAAYGSDPHPLAGLAYDGVAAVGALMKRGGRSPLSAASLAQGSGFQGTSGPFRFFPDGTNQRSLAVAEIRNKQVVVIDPAPRSFGGAGS